jgi:hypothetical protein
MPKTKQRKGIASHNKRIMTSTSALTSRASKTVVWNVFSQPKPSYSNALRIDNAPYRLRQTVDYGPLLTSSAGGSVFYSKSFVFSDIAQYTSLQAVFDQYRIDEMEVWWYPNNTASAATGSMLAVVDYDDSVTPSSLTQLQQYQNCVDIPLSSGGVYFKFKPHCAEAAFVSSFTGEVNVAAPWINCATPGVQHFGFKAGMNATSTTVVYAMVARYNISLRNVI